MSSSGYSLCFVLELFIFRPDVLNFVARVLTRLLRRCRMETIRVWLCIHFYLPVQVDALMVLCRVLIRENSGVRGSCVFLLLALFTVSWLSM